jgi:hypothetical protein
LWTPRGSGRWSTARPSLGRRELGLLAPLAASPHALAKAFARWQLADDDRRIVLVLVAAGLSPRVSRLLAVLGGDPTAPAVVVEAVAAVLAPGEAGVRRLAERVGQGALEALALVQISRWSASSSTPIVSRARSMPR